MGTRLYIIEAREVNHRNLTQEQREELREFMLDDIHSRRTDEVIAYYDEYILDQEMDEAPPLVREFLREQIRENGGSVNLQIA